MEPPDFLRQVSKQRDPESVFVQVNTGNVVAYPSGPYAKLNDEQAQLIRQNGYYEAVMLAETATGHILPISIEAGVNNGTDHIRKLASRRSDGVTPVYMRKRDYEALPAAKRDAMLLKKKTSVSREAELEAEVLALKAKLAEAPANQKGARS